MMSGIRKPLAQFLLLGVALAATVSGFITLRGMARRRAAAEPVVATSAASVLDAVSTVDLAVQVGRTEVNRWRCRSVAVWATGDHLLLRAVAQRLALHLREVPGVRRVDVVGGPAPFTTGAARSDLFVTLDLDRCDLTAGVDGALHLAADLALHAGSLPLPLLPPSTDRDPPLVGLRCDGTARLRASVAGGSWEDVTGPLADSLSGACADRLRREVARLVSEDGWAGNLPGRLDPPADPPPAFPWLPAGDAVLETAGLAAPCRALWQFRCPDQALTAIGAHLAGDGWTAGAAEGEGPRRFDRGDEVLLLQRPGRVFGPVAGPSDGPVLIAFYQRRLDGRSLGGGLDDLLADPARLDDVMAFHAFLDESRRRRLAQALAEQAGPEPERWLVLAGLREALGETAQAQAAARGAWFALRTGLVRKDASSRIRDLGTRLGIAAFDEGDDAAARCLAVGFTDLAGAAAMTIPPRLLRPGERAGFFLRLPSGAVKSTVVWVEHDPRLPEAAVVRHVDATDSARTWGEAPLAGPAGAARQHHVFFRRGLILRLAVEQPTDAPVFRLVVSVNPADATPPPGAAPVPVRPQP